MQGKRPKPPALTLSGAFYGFLLAGAIAVGLGIVWFVTVHSGRLLDSTLDKAVRIRTQSASETLARMLHADWSDLKFLAQEIAISGEGRVGGLMDGMRGDGTRISWIGLADSDGTVLHASKDMLVGRDVSERPWFRNGLTGPYAGDVHEAVLLAQLVDPGPDSLLRFIDLALPVRNETGETSGVVAAHINFDWAMNVLKEAAQTVGLDLFLLSADGSVILSTTDEAPGPNELRILAAARTGVAAAGREIWPDGREYFASLVPTVQYADLPNFGWRIVGRLDADTFRPDLRSVQGATLWTVFAILAALMALTAAFILIFLRPIEAIAESADRIADGEDIYPPDIRRTREAAMLSAAIARLQGELASRINRSRN